MKLLSGQVSEQEVRIIVRELRRALDADLSGDVVEFGCYVGTTSVYLQQELKDKPAALHVYDSFEGLPKKVEQDLSPAGEQFKEGELRTTKNQLIKNFKQSNVELPVIHKGWFSELTEQDIPQQIMFAYLDGDYYHSILDPLKLIWKHLTPGAIIVVDDYQNEQLPGVKKALDVWAQAHAFNLRVEASLAVINVR
jgi:O-methyltransferase